jgi:hypothetical protein
MDSDVTEVFLGMQVHPAARLLPMMAGVEFEDLKNSIREAGENTLPITVHNHVLLDGRNRAKAIEELQQGGVDVHVQMTEWNPRDRETAGEFIARVNLPRRHLTPDQKAAIWADLIPLIEEEQQQRRAASQIKAGEVRNPYGRGGRPETVDVESTPPSPEDLRQRNREKRERSTAGRIAASAGVTEHKARNVISAIRHGGDEAKQKLRNGTAKASDFLPAKKPRRRKVPRDFCKRVEEDYREIKKKYDDKQHNDLRSVLLQIIKQEQQWRGAAETAEEATAAEGVGRE